MLSISGYTAPAKVGLNAYHLACCNILYLSVGRVVSELRSSLKSVVGVDIESVPTVFLRTEEIKLFNLRAKISRRRLARLPSSVSSRLGSLSRLRASAKSERERV